MVFYLAVEMVEKRVVFQLEKLVEMTVESLVDSTNKMKVGCKVV